MAADIYRGFEGRGLQLRIKYSMSVKLQIIEIYSLNIRLSVMVMVQTQFKRHDITLKRLK